MNYCGLLQKEQNETLKGKFDCYHKHKVDIEHYGKEECDYSENPNGIATWYGPDYFNCIIRNEVPYDYKQACYWQYNYNDTYLLWCWQGCYSEPWNCYDDEYDENFTIIPDFDYCHL